MEFRSGPRRRSARLLPLYDGPDIISTLPDDLLLLVLARLPCAAAAARTGVLSRRWVGLWASLRQIVFNDVAFHSLEAALGCFPPPPPAVSLLQIGMPKPTKHRAAETTRFSSLLRAAARLHPEEFFLFLPSRFVGRPLLLELPCFHRTTSIVLDLCTTIRCVPAAAEFPALKTLSLSHCTADLGAFLSRCPRLRKLRLTDVWFHNGVLSVNSPLLQELVVASAKWMKQVNIVAPVLTQLTMSLKVNPSDISVLAPMVEKVSWDRSLSARHARFGIWSPSTSYVGGPDNFEQEIENHKIVAFSVLELHLTNKGHVYGAFVAFILEKNQIRCAMQRLKVNLQRSRKKEEDGCLPHCPCDYTTWKSQTISLTSLKEVEFSGFEGEDHEFDLLKFILRSAPMLKRIIMKLSREASASNERCTKIDNIFRVYSSVECYVYLSSGLRHGSWNCPSA